MFNPRSHFYGKPLTVLVTVLCAAALAGCGHRTVSGVYVQHDDHGATLLQLTQTPDQHLSGSFQVVALRPDGTIVKKVLNAEGVIDDDRLTLTIRTPELLAQSLNVGGKLVNGGIDFNFPATSVNQQVGVQHLVKGSVSDYAVAVNDLENRGNTYRQVGALDQSVDKLAHDLDQFVNQAKAHWIGKSAGVKSYFTRGVQQEQNRLAQVHRLLQSGGPVNRGQAEAVRGGMFADYAGIGNSYSTIDQAQQNEAEQERSLNQRIGSFQANCLDGKGVTPGQVIPSMGPCKKLASAVTAYQAVLPCVHLDMGEMVRIKAESKTKLDGIQREMDIALDH